MFNNGTVSNEVKLDSVDREILMLLQQDSKLKIKEIAHQVGLTVTPTHDRIKRLEKIGVIKQYTALLDKRKINKSLTAYCNVTLHQHSRPLIENFQREAAQIPEVMECMHMSGSYDYLLKVVVEDMNEYQRFISTKLAAIDNVANVQSSFVMTEVKNGVSFHLR